MQTLRCAQDEALLRGRSLESFAAAFYAACCIGGLSQTLGELAATAKAPPNELRAAFDAVYRELGLPTGPIDPAEYLPRFASRSPIPDSEPVTTPAGLPPSASHVAAAERGSRSRTTAPPRVADVAPVTLRATYTKLINTGRTGSEPAPIRGE